MKKIDPKKYNLSTRIKLFEDLNKQIVITIDRKSRIIMKDGLRVLEIAKKIKNHAKKQQVSLSTSAPICGKTKDFLKKNDIIIKPI